MGKIIGESFDPYVDLQVKIRQKKLGSKYKSDELLTKITSKNPWLRLTSGVNVITKEKEAEIGVTQGGNAIARYYQLQGGPHRGYFNATVDNPFGDQKYTPRGGVVSDYNDALSQAYGYRSSNEYGLVPLPSLESFEITPKNNGSLTQADITIKCYNKSQFQIIETLYLRLGFTLLLEWGHSVYTDNKGELISNPVNNDVSDHFLGPRTDDPLQEVQKMIAAEREDSCGNYDGLVGRVTNFDWDVTPDGHYTAKVKLTSTGDVIDSLRITPPLPTKEVEGEEGEIPDYKENVESTPLGKIIRVFREALDQSAIGRGLFGNTTVLGSYKKVPRDGYDRVRYYDGDSLTNEKIKEAAELETGYYNDPNKNYASKEIIRLNGQGLSSDYDYFYIKLGALLRIIQNFLLIYDTKHNNTPIVKIDWDYEDNQYFMPVQSIFSADPRILLVPSFFEIEDKFGRVRDFKDLNSSLGTEFCGEGNNFTFNFMHAYINMDFVIDTLTDNLNKENEVLLIDFLQAICEGINQSLSNLIQLEPFHDQNDNTLYLVNKCNSDVVLEKRGKLKDPTKFRVGLLPQGEREGSFVKNVSIGSTIPPNFATQIAIGAQANDTEVSSNSAPFSKWNEGLEDRIITDKQTGAGAGESEEDRKKRDKEAQDKKLKKQESLKQSVAVATKYYNTFDVKDQLFNLESAIKEYFKTQANAAEQELQSRIISPIVIPLSLNLTIDGLSGMKIFQKYTITEDFLPDNYQDSLEFIIKGIGHSISEGGWTTKIEGQCIPKIKYASV